MRTIKEALEEGSLSLEDEIDYDDTPQAEEIALLKLEIERLNNIIKNIENICESSIASVDNILQDEKETKIVNGRCINRNEYQIVRLKAYRTKSKEILEKIKELKRSDKE